MNRKTADRKHGLRTGAILVALLAAILLTLGGCGEFNERSGGGGLTVSFNFGGEGGAAPMAADSTTQGISFTGGGEPVLSVVVGAIVITHPNGSGPGGAFVPSDADTITPAEKDLLEEDVKASLKYLVIQDLPTSDDTITFLLPPNYADANWQLVAIGMRHNIDYLTDIAENSPIWFGFSDGFLNGVVGPGDTAPTITLEPWCTANDFPSVGLCPP